MMAWWKSLRPREQSLVAGGAFFVLIVVFYLLVWAPLQKDRHDLANRVEAHRQTITWMRNASAQIKALQAQAPSTHHQGAQRSLLSIIDDSSRQAKLRETIQRMEPEGKTGVKLRMEGADFDALIRWLGTLEIRYGVGVTRANLTRSELAGRVNARLSLSRP